MRQAIICTRGLSLNLKRKKSSKQPKRAPPHSSSPRHKEQHILQQEIVVALRRAKSSFLLQAGCLSTSQPALPARTFVLCLRGHPQSCRPFKCSAGSLMGGLYTNQSTFIKHTWSAPWRSGCEETRGQVSIWFRISTVHLPNSLGK